jgi:uncharacterized protein (DUF608 family)
MLEIARRDFLSLGMLAAAGAAIGVWPPKGAIAGPFTIGDADDFLIPADKKLDPAWVASLTARGEPTVYRSSLNELSFIGMPIGGICCGQVYLGGDGSLWHWDIFNVPQAEPWSHSSGFLYAKPARPASPLSQGFGMRITVEGVTQERTLDASGFTDIQFKGQYPIGTVHFESKDCPIRATLEAMSPFCPLDADASGTPAIVLSYTLSNTSSKPAEVTIGSWLENAVCKFTGKDVPGVRRSRVLRETLGVSTATTIEHSARPLRDDEAKVKASRPEIVFEDWEKGEYGAWVTQGTAFGDKPRRIADIPGYQGNLAARGKWTVNSHETRRGENVAQADAHLGSLTSEAFVIERDFITFRIGGGNHPGQTCVNLLIDGAAVRTATGNNNNQMSPHSFDVKELAGRKAKLQIMDGWSGAWGNIGCDQIVFSDQPAREPYDMPRAPDFGTMSLSVVGPPDQTDGYVVARGEPKHKLAGATPNESDDAESPFGEPGREGVVRHRPFTLAPGESRTVTFVLAWCFPNPNRASLSFLTDSDSLVHWYAGKHKDAAAVRAAVIGGLESMSGTTRRWRDTWYDSTLPHWFLDRTFATVSTAATATCLRFTNGRFYGWEGTYCCPGTCTHVWHYAQGLARVFPSLERSTREMIDFGLAFRDETGQIDYRAEAGKDLAVDGQCGTIMRAYREHQMTGDDRFLKAVWPRVKKAVRLMLSRDPDSDGILDGPQYNTLDATWYGQISWLTSLYLAALRAGESMATEMGDAAFATECARVADRGRDTMVARLFNGEYFIHKTDPAHPEANSTGEGCHIDQVLGQSWAHQVDMGRIIPIEQTRAALRSLYRYSFAPDIGPYRKIIDATIKGGRWYAMPGEGGLLMCTWPKGGEDAATGKGGEAWAAGYFNECMTGFEHQVASHMIAEGLVTEGLAVTRMIHDRYHAKLRNPWNEIECSNHYARAMASYGSFVTASGFRHHGPRGTIGFAPKITPDDFRCAFITAAGWGQFRQTRTPDAHRAAIEVRWGQVSLTSVSLDLREGLKPHKATVRLGEAVLPCVLVAESSGVRITFATRIAVTAGSTLNIEIT